MTKFWFLLGLPCSGKTTTGEYLASRRLGAVHISTGDIARQLGEEDPTVAQLLAMGKVAPPGKMDEKVSKILWEHIEKGTEVVIVDGYPRYMEQMADVCCMLRDDDRLLQSVRFVHLDIPVALASSRSQQRTDRIEGSASFSRRCLYFSNETKRVLDYLRARGAFPLIEVKIDGKTTEQVAKEILDRSG